ncbi:hypothetical protein SDC9_113184 [bioreactor metagenome]|uniref:Uncharacterized protein n=1 Tax=bioreactor metagenome TaxID=1076179 RepID=A0A645BM14_9ZZZZ
MLGLKLLQLPDNVIQETGDIFRLQLLKHASEVAVYIIKKMVEKFGHTGQMEQIIEIMNRFQTGHELFGEAPKIVGNIVIKHDVSELFPCLGMGALGTQMLKERMADLFDLFRIHHAEKTTFGRKPFFSRGCFLPIIKAAIQNIGSCTQNNGQKFRNLGNPVKTGFKIS